MSEILTIGHSTESYGQFLRRLQSAGVTAVADVRSSPFSRRSPHFSHDELRSRLREDGISYSFLGEELGGRPKSDSLYANGVANYEKMSTTPHFMSGIARLVSGSSSYMIAVMCSEFHPAECHRCLLVGRKLHEQGHSVSHILAESQIVSHSVIENWMMDRLSLDTGDFFVSDHERLVKAYKEQALRYAYSKVKSAGYSK